MLSKFTENLNKKINSRTSKNTAHFKMPAVTRVNSDFVSLKKGIIIGLILHPVVVVILWLIIVILAIFGINLSIMQKPEPKVNDIEFVLVDKEQTPKDKNTKFRADMNSRTGGVNDPIKPVSMPSSQPAAKPAPSSSSSPAPKKSIVDKIAQSVAPKSTQNKAQPKATTTQKNVTPSPVVEQPVQKPQAAKPQPPTAKPSVRPSLPNPKPVQKPTNTPFKVAVPSGGTTTGQYSTGPISGSGSNKNGGSKGSGTYSPNPTFAPVGNSGTRTANGSGAGKGSGTGTGSGGSGSGNGGGNPGGGGGHPGIDAIREPDFGPYMKDLQRRVKMNWDPPKGNESKRVVLLFKIAKDGRLLSCSVFKSSGLQSADNAAINAVKLAAPFKPLPTEYKGQNIDIQFTFDYNVFGASIR